jgi:hypothetical protein
LSTLYKFIKTNENEINECEEVEQIKQLKKEFQILLFDMIHNSDNNIRMNAIYILSVLINKEENPLLMEAEEKIQVKKQLMEISFDLLQNPDNNIRMSAFAIVSSMLSTKEIQLPGEQDKKQLVQKFIDGWIDLLRNADVDLQIMLLSLIPKRTIKQAVDGGEEKRLREVLINLQKSPNKQIRDIANKILDVLSDRNS